LIPSGVKSVSIIHDSFPSVDDRIGEVAAYMLLKNYPSSIIEKFYGICDEYDFTESCRVQRRFISIRMVIEIF